MNQQKFYVMMKLTKILSTSLLFCNFTFAQTAVTKLYSVSFLKGQGNVFSTNSTLKGANEIGFPVKKSKRTGIKIEKKLNSKAWHTDLHNPTIGIQIFKTCFEFEDYKFQQIGSPLIVSGTYRAPFIQKNKFSFGYNFGLGAAMGWKTVWDGNDNLAIGSKNSFYIELGLNLRRELNKHFDVGLNVGLTHYSNGATKLPNYGINIANAFLNLDYKFGKEQEIKVITHKEKFKSKITFDASFFMASKSTMVKEDTVFFEYSTVKSVPVYGFSGVASKDINRRNKLGIGITLTQNRANEIVKYQKDEEEALPQYEVFTIPDFAPTNIRSKLMISSYLAYELQFGNVSVLVQPSFYLYRGIKLDYIPSFYQRLGIRYNTKNNIFLGFNLRAYDYHISDFIEWNIGYSFK